MKKKGWVGTINSHPHNQSVYVVRGHLIVTSRERRFDVRSGDAFVVSGGVEHGARAAAQGEQQDILSSDGSTLTVQALYSRWPLRISVFATSNSLLGRGAPRPIPLHLVLQSKDVLFAPGQPKTWAIELSVGRLSNSVTTENRRDQ